MQQKVRARIVNHDFVRCQPGRLALLKMTLIADGLDPGVLRAQDLLLRVSGIARAQGVQSAVLN